MNAEVSLVVGGRRMMGCSVFWTLRTRFCFIFLLSFQTVVRSALEHVLQICQCSPKHCGNMCLLMAMFSY